MGNRIKGENHFIIFKRLSRQGGTFFLTFPFFLLFSLSPVLTDAQGFGTNQLITRNYAWHTVQTEHFEIYYYPEIENQIEHIKEILELAYQRISRDLNHKLSQATPVFIYANHNNFEENNIALIGEGTGGFSEIFKNRLVIPLTGSERDLQIVLTHELTHIFNFDLWYGGGWKSLKILKSPLYPLWIMEGLAEYEANDLDAYGEMLLRDAVISKRVIPLTHLRSFYHLPSHDILLAYKESQSALIYIAETYGKGIIRQLLDTTKNRFDFDAVIWNVFRMSEAKFSQGWQEWLEKKYTRQIEGKSPPQHWGKPLTQENEFNTNATWSPDGRFIAFISDRGGVADLWLMDSDGRNQHSLLKSAVHTKIDVIHSAGKALTWAPNGRYIAFVGEKNQQDYIYVYRFQRKRGLFQQPELKRISTGLAELKSLNFAPDNQHIIFVGMKNGINNLYLIDIDKGELKQLTDDAYDVDYPRFSADGKEVVFISERERQKDLFILDIASNQVQRLTNTPWDEISPVFYGERIHPERVHREGIIFVSDKTNIFNLYQRTAEGEIKQLTDVNTGIFNPEISPDGKKLLFAGFSCGRMDIYQTELARLGGLEEEKVSPEAFQCACPDYPLEPHPLKLNLPCRRYAFKPSTDLFLPMGVVAGSNVGFFARVAAWYQGSDILGDHQFGFYTVYFAPEDWLEYQIYYNYLKRRLKFGFAFLGDNDVSFDEVLGSYVHLHRRIEQAVFSYPLDRFNRFEFGLVTASQKWLIPVESDGTEFDISYAERENGAQLAFVRDTSKRRYLDILSGRRLRLEIYQALRVFNGDYEYTECLLNTQRYWTVARDKTFALRLLGVSCFGPDRQPFFIGGGYFIGSGDNLRGYGYGELEGYNIILNNLELRFPLFEKLNWDIYLFGPGVLIKRIWGSVFTDTGIAWNKPSEFCSGNVKNSIGFGVRMDIFLQQMLYYTIRLDFATPTNRRGAWQWCLAFGSLF